ncbi:hypothetical protein AVEN_115212-1 [Araneus ventricosus]|uniref:Uncharacterized protein n=1 Tax=Araneus ventricosus TaxID=182803 RepID=A0A4Y1ZXP1_ARAVE|nr:hypothetical protein AVEN_115212-1 [Araneus ventricosus]
MLKMRKGSISCDGISKSAQSFEETGCLEEDSRSGRPFLTEGFVTAVKLVMDDRQPSYLLGTEALAKLERYWSCLNYRFGLSFKGSCILPCTNSSHCSSFYRQIFPIGNHFP